MEVGAEAERLRIVGIEDAIYVNTSISDAQFREEEIVFKIQAVSVDGEILDNGVVQTYQDYFKNIRSHQYTPILHIAPLEIRLAYIYGCLNVRYGEERNSIFRILYRFIKTDEWETWMMIYPYSEKIRN